MEKQAFEIKDGMDFYGKKRLRSMLSIILLIFIGLIIRLSWIQLVDGRELKELAELQQSLDRYINPRRGTIYDATEENVLAISSTVETVTINPTNISKEKKELVAQALANIFTLDYETVLKKVKKNSSIEFIAKKVEQEKTDELRKWMKENNVSIGINIDEDTKRYYPYNSLAAHIIGFCGSDNQGLDGIEAKYDSVLKGEKGRIIRNSDAKGGELKNAQENYIPAVNGSDLVLSIDANIQSIVEKYLSEACIDNVCTDGGNVIAMNPKNGDILAMATYPSYNLNEPYKINNEELNAIWESMEQSEKTVNLQQMWRNKAIADTYEPGSTFKVITTAAALEESIVTDIDAVDFCCSGGIEVAGVRIKCWRYYRPHGSESLRQALMNSCNPIFIGLGQKVGVEKYYNYLENFGLLNNTGIELPGEARGIFLKEEKVGPVELATISFGQRFEITPIQLATAVSAIANGGELVQPRIVKKIVNSETKEIQEIETIKKGRVISEENSKKILTMMESVVAEGTGKNAQVKGYTIGGKTGTSEDGVNTNKYVTSFVGVASISNPEVVVLVTLYNPTGEGGHQGGAVAAPVGGKILADVVEYLELEKDNLKEEDIIEKVEIPDIRNLTIKEAKKVLNSIGLKLNIQEEIDEESIVKEQTPKPGIIINIGQSIEAIT